jgi:hypothetical protein
MKPDFVRAMADTVSRVFISNPYVDENTLAYMYDVSMALYSYADFVEYTCVTGPQNIYLDELLDEIFYTLDNDPTLHRM